MQGIAHLVGQSAAELGQLARLGMNRIAHATRQLFALSRQSHQAINGPHVCHNRQGHAIATTRERAVDDALARGLIPRTLPFVRREVLAALTDVSGEPDAVRQRIADRLRASYATQGPPAGTNGGDVDQAIAAAQRVYTGNVFPRMNVAWGTYPTQLGHTDSNGCFRCHDELHKSKDGRVISQDCEMCHKLE